MPRELCEWVFGLVAESSATAQIVCELTSPRGCAQAVKVYARHGQGCPVLLCVSEDDRLIGATIGTIVEVEFYDDDEEAGRLIRAILAGNVEETLYEAAGAVQKASIRWWYEGEGQTAWFVRWWGMWRRTTRKSTTFARY